MEGLPVNDIKQSQRQKAPKKVPFEDALNHERDEQNRRQYGHDSYLPESSRLAGNDKDGCQDKEDAPKPISIFHKYSFHLRAAVVHDNNTATRILVCDCY